MPSESRLESRPARAVIAIDAFVAVGFACIVAGGVVAAVTGPLDLEHGSWLAAYLVLVGGVTTAAIGVAQQALPPEPPAHSQTRVELGCLCVGNTAVIGGTLITAPFLVDAGGLTLAVSLAIAFVLTREAPAHRRVAIAYRCLLAFIALSIPVGLVLAHVRS